MSRFWAASSSSEDEKGSDSDVYDEPVVRPADRKFASTYVDSDSESEDEVRVVKSHKDRAWDSMAEGIVKIRNARKNSDWPLIQDEFGNVNKMIEKSKMLILQSGIPNFYIKMLAEVEDHVQSSLKDKESIKKMKPVVSRALNQMKLQVRKHNEHYKEQIADYRENPAKYADAEDEDSSSSDDDSDSSSDDSDSSSDEDIKPKTKPSKKVADDDDSLSTYESSSGDDSDSDSDDGGQELKGRARWLKRTVDPSAVREETKKKSTVQRVGKKKEYAETAPLETKRTAVDEDLTEEELDQRVMYLVSSRGKKNTDSREVLRQLEMLTKSARPHGPRKEIIVLMHLISAMLDSHRTIDEYMDLQQWRTCHRSLNRVVCLLEDHPTLVLGLLGADEVSDLALTAHLKATATSSEPVPTDKTETVVKVVGSLESFLLRLEDEYTKSLQQINPHTQEYIIRLSDEASLMEQAEQVLAYLQRVGDLTAAAQVALLVVEHLYYKHDSHATAVHSAHTFSKKWGKHSELHPACTGNIPDFNGDSTARSVDRTHPASFLGNPTVAVSEYLPGHRLEELSGFIFAHGDERSKTRALLCTVHHNALHDEFYKARDLFLISHVQDFIDKADVKTQILYNRAVVTLGLCAFRQGLFQKAHDCLSGICAGRVKELLAQGQTRWPDKDPEQEKVERRRQMPYHMHINPDLLECCHLTSAMLLELPSLARGHLPGTYNHIISKQFRKYLLSYSKQVFTGPPESTRETVMAATKSILAGDWQRAVDLLTGLEVWNLIPGDGGEKAKVMLRQRLKEEAVRTFMLLNGANYESLSLEHICMMFDVEQNSTRRIISRMIFDREISAAWESPADILVMYKADSTALQSLAFTVSEKVGYMLESNERMLDPLVGLYGYKDDWNDQRRGPDHRSISRTAGSGGRGGRGVARGTPSGGRGGRGSQYSDSRYGGSRSGSSGNRGVGRGNNRSRAGGAIRGAGDGNVNAWSGDRSRELPRKTWNTAQ